MATAVAQQTVIQPATSRLNASARNRQQSPRGVLFPPPSQVRDASDTSPEPRRPCLPRPTPSLPISMPFSRQHRPSAHAIAFDAFHFRLSPTASRPAWRDEQQITLHAARQFCAQRHSVRLRRHRIACRDTACSPRRQETRRRHRRAIR